MTESNWIAKSIVPKSDQLNAEDLLSGPITVTVADVKQGSAEQPVALMIDGDRQPYKPCKTMRKVLVYCWTDQAANWIGKRMTLYADPDVKWAGIAVGGIRISHLSGISKEVTLMLSETRGKRKAYSVKPLADAATDPPENTDGFASDLTKSIESATTSKQLDDLSVSIRQGKARGTLKQDQFDVLKSMVVEARNRLQVAPQ